MNRFILPLLPLPAGCMNFGLAEGQILRFLFQNGMQEKYCRPNYGGCLGKAFT